MSRCIHVCPFVARNYGGIPFSGVCPIINSRILALLTVSEGPYSVYIVLHGSPRHHTSEYSSYNTSSRYCMYVCIVIT